MQLVFEPDHLDLPARVYLPLCPQVLKDRYCRVVLHLPQVNAHVIAGHELAYEGEGVICGLDGGSDHSVHGSRKRSIESSTVRAEGANSGCTVESENILVMS